MNFAYYRKLISANTFENKINLCHILTCPVTADVVPNTVALYVTVMKSHCQNEQQQLSE